MRKSVLYGLGALALHLGVLIECGQAQTPLAFPGLNAKGYAGVAVALHGDLAVVGAQDDDGGTGATYVFERKGNEWEFVEKLSPPTEEGVSRYGQAVALEADLLAIGAPYKGNASSGGNGPGTVYVYRLVSGTWLLEATLQPNDSHTRDQFGAALDLDGERLTVGAPKAIFESRTSGVAYVFERQDPDGTGVSMWVQTRAVAQGDASSRESFGGAVALQGETWIVGAWEHSEPAAMLSGAVYVFERDGSSWTFAKEFIPANELASSNTRLGFRVASSQAQTGEEYFLVSGPGRNQVYVLEKRGGVWTHTTSLAPPRPENVDFFGSALAADGDYALVGEMYSNARGAAWLFKRALNGTWERLQALPFGGERNSFFGQALALHHSHAVVGAPGTTALGAEGTGAAFTYDLSNVIIKSEETTVPTSQTIETQVIPNPATTEAVLHFRLPSSLGANSGGYLEVFDLVGRRVIAKQLSSAKLQNRGVGLDLNTLPAGIYMYRLQVGRGSTSGSFVKGM